MESLCNYCDAPATLECSRCHDVHYCSRDHRRCDYPNHYAFCRNYAVNSDPTAGAYIVSSCVIVPGRLILQESPLLVGPRACSAPVCLACHAPLQEEFFRCPDCTWPMCSLRCANQDSHARECEVLALDTAGIGVPQSGDETPRYDLIILLRALLLRESNPPAWECMMSMESHAKLRKEEGDDYHDAAVKYFTDVCKVDFDEDIIHHIRGAIVTNSIEIRGQENNSLRALYPTIRLFNHSCIPNVTLTSTPDGVIEARASTKIKKNVPLCICYTGTMEPLWKRQQHLSKVYKFNCCCQRCLDPTELGTYFSSPRCPMCRRAFMLPNGDGSVDEWTCEQCGFKYEYVDVLQEYSEWMYRMDVTDNASNETIKQLVKRVFTVQDSFNALHYIPLQYTQYMLNSITGKCFRSYKLRQEIWSNHLQLFNILEPGFTRRRGVTLFQVAKASLSLAKSGRQEKELCDLRQQQLLEQTRSCLTEALQIMRLEPPGSRERRWVDELHVVARDLVVYQQQVQHEEQQKQVQHEEQQQQVQHEEQQQQVQHEQQQREQHEKEQLESGQQKMEQKNGVTEDEK